MYKYRQRVEHVLQAFAIFIQNPLYYLATCSIVMLF